MKAFTHTYEDIISLENLLFAWKEFVRGKQSKKDVLEFSLDLSCDIFKLHESLKNKTYTHSDYKAFAINDPKPRNIHKASVRDRLIHHAIYRVLYTYFDSRFIFDSYSCRNFKGTHRALNRFRDFERTVSRNNRRTCWILKCDVRKFFASVDQNILISILKRHIPSKDILWLLELVIESFNSGKEGIGLPLGNLTSQLLVNVYMNELDQYIKHELKVKYYIRYADDFVILSHNKEGLEKLLPKISEFLEEKLKLKLHPNKVFIKTFASGVDFLGWVHFPDHRVLRTSTKKRMLRRLTDNPKLKVKQSYLGLLSHGNTEKLQARIH
ncbi:MAG: reverse transcriptase/maturase family protein [bacterium]|nr:reverse transcriptase/maturase family protein [bacterium]